MGGKSMRAPVLLTAIFSSLIYATVYYVAVNGNNAPTNGSQSNPWATVDYALSHIDKQGGDTVVVKDGTYNGRTYSTEAFNDWVVIKAEHDYRAKLTNIQNNQGGEIFGIYTPGYAKVIIQGFIFSNTHDSYLCNGRESNVAVHFQDASDIIFQNNIIFGNNAPGTCNELLKINRGSADYYPRNIHVRSNVFYDHVSAGGADMIDAVRPGELDIYENIFFARQAPGAQSFITLKREVQEAAIPASYLPARSIRHKVYKNVFLNWDGKSDQAFIQFGEDGHAEYMITNSLIENNLIIGNSDNSIVGAIQLKGTKNITVRANTVTGNLPGSSFGFRIGTEGSNLRSSDFFIYNNIWSDPTGTMTNRFINTYGDVDVSSIELDNNLFWNDGNGLPTQGSVLPDDDANRIVADPLLEKNQDNIVLPIWDENAKQFLSGKSTIRQEFERLVNTYGALQSGSPAIDSADPGNMPDEDILGHKRDSLPDIGCFEFGATAIYRNKKGGFGQALYLYQARPNPFNSKTLICYSLKEPCRVQIKIHNLCGQLIRILVDSKTSSGKHSIVWNGKNELGCKMPSGIYICQIMTGREIITRKMILMQ
jgi:hypothetical protein